MKLRVGLVQTRTPANQADSLIALEPLVHQAAADGAQLVVTPEGSNFLQKDRGQREVLLKSESDDPVVQAASGWARELGVWLALGSVIVRSGDPSDDRAANRSLLFDPAGEIAARYDKLHVYDVDLPSGESWRESAAIRPGDRAVVAATPWGGLGLTVCYDLRFPHLFRRLAQAGADLITVPAAFTVPTGQAHWEVLLRARAIETGAFVLAPAQGGLHEDGRATYGHALIIGPWGEVVARLDHDRPGVLMADLDLDAVTRARQAVPQLTHDRDFTAPTPVTP